nr:very-long-chain (3R)-3-hydroxyacyl-CoA dehydratase PASTICCINO 2 [Ipomoea batatas]
MASSIPILRSAFSLIFLYKIFDFGDWDFRVQVFYLAVKTLMESGHENVYQAVEKPLLLAQSAAVLEIIRYSFFGTKEAFGRGPSGLLWLRYSSFILLYPTGITSEVGLIYKALPYLKLTYLDRLEFKGNKIQRISPAITSWTEEKVRERIKSEVKSGQFGRGKVIPRFEREEQRVHERIDENVQADLSDESLKKVTSVLRKMANTVVEFGEVMAEIGNSKTGGGIIKRTFENIAEMINGVSSSQPPQQQGLLDDDDIFNQPSFLDAVSALEQAFLQTRKNYAAQPEQPTTSQSQHHIQTPSFDLGVPSPQPAAMEQPQNKIDSTELRNIARDLDEDSEKTISDEQQLDTTPEDNTMKQLFDSEQLFEYAGYYLDRETFQSMRAGELESVIVDVWCLRLNQLDLNRGLDKPKRIFFSTQAFIQLDSPTNWEKGENAEQSSYQTDFEQCLDTEINNVGKLDISDAQLVNNALCKKKNCTSN